ncbi:SixA phosphatase family protein [Streptomyces gilvosporeus]|uniref:Phosphohistidine phosphatase n=1 Tax=Streptomyces gilvosporeus TaxID=553510 RepID=A0A1V0U2N0_9ACTN|nr:histidine phosphatase family protein [Streptomyces gilvosporeus]ARF59268.1 phosphohistidine phosphatase [Streptomyces gilvosporeus]
MPSTPSAPDARPTRPGPFRLVVLRHAKSAWPDAEDRDRPLAPRGRRDAPAAGRRLADAGCLPDAVVCSPSRRTRETWELVAEQFAAAPPVTFDDRVYGASAARLLDVVRETPAGVRTLLLIGHQPGVQDLVLSLAGGGDDEALARVREKFPTSGLAVLESPVPWPEFGAGGALLADFAVPRGVKHKSGE